MKPYSFLLEAIDKDNSYNDALKIFNSLSEEEKFDICPKHGKYKDLPVTYRHVIKNKGFVDVYPHKQYGSKIGFIIIAVSPKYRGTGITHELMNKCIEDCKKLNVQKLWWVCLNKNESSYHTALKNGFKLQKTGKNETRFYKELK